MRKHACGLISSLQKQTICPKPGTYMDSLPRLAETMANSTIVFFTTILLRLAVFSEDPFVSTEEMAKWLHFDQPVSLKCTNAEDIVDETLSNATKKFHYSNDSRINHSWTIAVFEKGTLFGNKREQVEKSVREQGQRMKQIFKDNRKEFMKTDAGKAEKIERGELLFGGIGVKEIKNQEVFFTVSGFGPGGEEYMVFTRLPEVPYDLLLIHSVCMDQPPGMVTPPKNAPTPQADLASLFHKIQIKILKKLKTNSKTVE